MNNKNGFSKVRVFITILIVFSFVITIPFLSTFDGSVELQNVLNDEPIITVNTQGSAEGSLVVGGIIVGAAIGTYVGWRLGQHYGAESETTIDGFEDELKNLYQAEVHEQVRNWRSLYKREVDVTENMYKEANWRWRRKIEEVVADHYTSGSEEYDNKLTLSESGVMKEILNYYTGLQMGASEHINTIFNKMYNDAEYGNYLEDLNFGLNIHGGVPAFMGGRDDRIDLMFGDVISRYDDNKDEFWINTDKPLWVVDDGGLEVGFKCLITDEPLDTELDRSYTSMEHGTTEVHYLQSENDITKVEFTGEISDFGTIISQGIMTENTGVLAFKNDIPIGFGIDDRGFTNGGYSINLEIGSTVSGADYNYMSVSINNDNITQISSGEYEGKLLHRIADIIETKDSVINDLENIGLNTMNGLVDGFIDPETLVGPSIVAPDPAQYENMTAEELMYWYMAYIEQLEKSMEENEDVDWDDITISTNIYEDLRIAGRVYDDNDNLVLGTEEQPVVFVPTIMTSDFILQLGNNTLDQRMVCYEIGDAEEGSWRTTIKGTMEELTRHTFFSDYTVEILNMTNYGEMVESYNLEVSSINYEEINWTWDTGTIDPRNWFETDYWYDIISEHLIPIGLVVGGIVIMAGSTDQGGKQLGLLLIVLGIAIFGVTYLHAEIQSWKDGLSWLVVQLGG